MVSHICTEGILLSIQMLITEHMSPETVLTQGLVTALAITSFTSGLFIHTRTQWQSKPILVNQVVTTLQFFLLRDSV